MLFLLVKSIRNEHGTNPPPLIKKNHEFHIIKKFSTFGSPSLFKDGRQLKSKILNRVNKEDDPKVEYFLSLWHFCSF